MTRTDSLTPTMPPSLGGLCPPSPSPRFARRSTRVHCAAVLAALLAVSCGDAQRSLLTGAPNPPADVQQACALATAKCSRCHPIDRVVVARGIGVGRWQMYVEQMRL